MKGSSPRVWGQVYCHGAGRIFNEDHPHACGDKAEHLDKSKHQSGSSPRVWGQAVSTYTTEDDSRIIPTRVGTRNFEKFRICNSQDHPHACGDKGNKSKDYVIGVGSSPRVWGQASVSVACTGWSRIIPTRVGTSFTIMPTPEVYEDHPHACGDKTYKGENNTGTEGSSPRVWGQGKPR